MKRILLLAVVLAFVFKPNPSQAQDPLPYLVTYEPSSQLLQGGTALVRVSGANLVEVRATFLGKGIEFHLSNVGDWVGFIAAGVEAPIGDQILDIFARTEGQQVPFHSSEKVTVLVGGFDVQAVELPYSMEALLDADLNTQNFATLERVYSRISPERLFTTFIQPVPGPSISDFGGLRNYNNGTLYGRHTGSDYRAVVGTPIGAASEGRVVFAGFLPIHGNHVVLDHGWGVLTGYSHLSEILVVPGQLVRQSQTIALVGATGRVQGPHLHFEVAVNGFWVDPVQFLTLTIPFQAP